MRSFLERRDSRPDGAYDNFLKDQLLQAMEGRSVYKSPDICTLDTITIPPGGAEAIRIPLSPQELLLLNRMSVSSLGFMGISVRSRWAQAGLEIGGGPDSTAHPIYTKPGGFIYDEGFNAYIAKIIARNHAKRPLQVSAGSHLFRYFYIDDGNRLHGDRLMQMLSNEDVWVYGVPVKDWGLTYGRALVDGKPDPIGLYLTVHPETFRAVDPMDPAPLTVSDDIADFRQELDDELKPVRELPIEQLLIGETSRLKLPNGVNGIISPFAWAWDSVFDQDQYNYHTCSRLLNGGDDHPIRVEIKTAAYPKVNSQRVYIDLYQE